MKTKDGVEVPDSAGDFAKYGTWGGAGPWGDYAIVYRYHIPILGGAQIDVLLDQAGNVVYSDNGNLAVRPDRPQDDVSELQNNFDLAVARTWNFRFYYDGGDDDAYAANDPTTGAGTTFRVAKNGSIYDAFDAGDPTVLANFLSAIKPVAVDEPPDPGLGTTDPIGLAEAQCYARGGTWDGPQCLPVLTEQYPATLPVKKKSLLPLLLGAGLAYLVTRP